MTNQQPKDEPKTLYQITGDVADINTVLINRGELSGLRADLERVNMQLVACGVVAMSDTPDSAKKARIMHPDYESSSLDDVKRRVDECIELRTRVAELEAQLESIGAGGVGPLIAAPQPSPVEQPPRYLDGGSRYKVTHLKTSGYCILGIPKELLGRWVALVDATDNKHMAGQQPPAVEQQQGEQEPVGEAGSMPGTDGFTMACFRASDVPVGTKLYTHPQNLRCKSNQARLATLWGYEKPQPPRQPLTDEEILRIKGQFNGTLDVQFDRFARAIERAHGIIGDA